MTFTRKFSGDRTAPIVCTYTCPAHGEFDAEVLRDENGEAPDAIPCATLIAAYPLVEGGRCEVFCEKPATWTPSPAIACRVRRIEVARGKWEKPERPTYLDTRDLGEGQDPEEFWEKREKVWDEERHKLVKELAQ